MHHDQIKTKYVATITCSSALMEKFPLQLLIKYPKIDQYTCGQVNYFKIKMECHLTCLINMINEVSKVNLVHHTQPNYTFLCVIWFVSGITWYWYCVSSRHLSGGQGISP